MKHTDNPLPKVSLSWRAQRPEDRPPWLRRALPPAQGAANRDIRPHAQRHQQLGHGEAGLGRLRLPKDGLRWLQLARFAAQRDVIMRTGTSRESGAAGQARQLE